MIYATGDTHGSFQRFGSKCFPEQKVMGRDDYVIICGDFGGVWADTPEENYWLNWLEEKPFTTLFVSGNHENFDLLAKYPVEEWHSGKVQRIRPHILHLLRGQLYEIEGHSFFTMGGASSHDIQDGILDPAEPDFERQYRLKQRFRQRFRVKGVSWWPEELPSEEEYAAAVETLEQGGWRADYVISHCAPTSVIQKIDSGYQADPLTEFFEMVNQRLDFRCWLFGHYHDNKRVTEKHILLWEQIVQVV